eukprot:s1580_g6.t1
MGICHGCSGCNGCNAPAGCPSTVCVVLTDDVTSWTIPKRNKYRPMNDDHEEEEPEVEVQDNDMASAPFGQNGDAKLELVFEEDSYQRLVASDDFVAPPQQGMQLNQLRIKQPSQGPRGTFLGLPGCAKGSTAPECGMPKVCKKFPHNP